MYSIFWEHLPQWGFQSNLLAHLLCIMHICDFLLPLPSHTESRIYGHMAIAQGDDTIVGIQHILDLMVHNGLFHLKREICRHYVSTNSHERAKVCPPLAQVLVRYHCTCLHALLLESMLNQQECKSQTKTAPIRSGLRN